MSVLVSTIRKKRLETCLNGKNACFKQGFLQTIKNSIVFVQSKQRVSQIFCIPSLSKQKHNSVPNQLYPRKQSGLYMIRCQINDWRYYGESSNVSGRLASHKSLLKRHLHPNANLQSDWNLYGESSFDFIVLFMGSNWDLSYVRRGKETELIVLNRHLAYNVLEDASRPGEKNPFWKRLHTPETKKKISQALKDRPNNLLGQAVSVKGNHYPSIAEASRQTGIARKTIRNKIIDPSNLDFYKIE
jgi:GIY-YIG catalytic domain/NUMOD3 motif